MFLGTGRYPLPSTLKENIQEWAPKITRVVKEKADPEKAGAGRRSGNNQEIPEIKLPHLIAIYTQKRKL